MRGMNRYMSDLYWSFTLFGLLQSLWFTPANFKFDGGLPRIKCIWRFQRRKPHIFFLNFLIVLSLPAETCDNSHLWRRWPRGVGWWLQKSIATYDNDCRICIGTFLPPTHFCPAACTFLHFFDDTRNPTTCLSESARQEKPAHDLQNSNFSL